MNRRIPALITISLLGLSGQALADELLLSGVPAGPRVAYQDLAGRGMPKANVQQVSFEVCAALTKLHKKRAILCRFALAQLAQKQPKVRDFFGCTSPDCYQKSAALLNARWVVYGVLSKVGKKVQLELVLFDAKKGREKRRVIERAKHAGAILKRVETAVRGLRL